MLEGVGGVVAGYVLFALSCGLVCIDSTCVIPCTLHALVPSSACSNAIKAEWFDVGWHGTHYTHCTHSTCRTLAACWRCALLCPSSPPSRESEENEENEESEKSEKREEREEMASVSAVSGGRVGYPFFHDAAFINKPVLILDGGTDNYPIQNKWIR